LAIRIKSWWKLKPLELLKLANVDLSSPEPIRKAVFDVKSACWMKSKRFCLVVHDPLFAGFYEKMERASIIC